MGDLEQNPDDKDYVLALTWMPAFCEGNAKKPECKSQHAGRYDALNFSLHGLWPQPFGNFYCGVADRNEAIDKSGRWHQLPKLELSKALRRALAEQMPGYSSNLHRHEWVKHGTCMGDISAETYYFLSMKLQEMFNQSPLLDLWRGNLRKQLTYKKIKTVFEEAFGENAGKRIRINCRRDGNRQLITGLHVSLRGELMKADQLAPLILAAEPLQNACKAGVVDPVGYQ